MEEAKVKIKVNGKGLFLKPFIQEMVKNVIVAMLQSLKIEDKEIREIEIRINV